MIPRKLVSAQGAAAIANHSVIVNSLRVVNLLRVVFLVRRGPLGSVFKTLAFRQARLRFLNAHFRPSKWRSLRYDRAKGPPYNGSAPRPPLVV